MACLRITRNASVTGLQWTKVVSGRRWGITVPKAWLCHLTDYGIEFQILGVPLKSFTKGRLKSVIHLKTDPCDCYMENEFKSKKVGKEAETIKKTTVKVQARDTI